VLLILGGFPVLFDSMLITNGTFKLSRLWDRRASPNSLVLGCIARFKCVSHSLWGRLDTSYKTPLTVSPGNNFLCS
jgi:hypothetical protein